MIVSKPISIQLYTVREYMEPEGEQAVLEHIARAGYDAVECGTPKDGAESYLKRVNDLGMKVSSYFGPPPTAETVNETIEIAQALQVKNVVCGFWIPEFESLEAIQKVADQLNPAIEALSRHGLNLCLHNHWFEFDSIAGDFAINHLMQRAPGLKMETDIYWASAFGTEDVAAFVAANKAKIPLLHVKDGPLVKGEPHVAVGSGKMPIPEILAAADPSVLDWWVVELDECGTDMWAAVEQSAAYLKSLS